MSGEIKVRFPDGTESTYPEGSNAIEVANSISEGLARATIVAKVNGVLTDATQPLPSECELELLKFDTDEAQQVFWHSSAHVLAQAILRHYPDAKPTIGPPIKDGGFYYDFANLTLTEEDLPKIEAEMKKIVKENPAITRQEYASKDEALSDFQHNTYKTEIIGQAQGNLSAYTQGEFKDLCRGPHIPRISMIKAVWLSQISGAYWRADANNEQLTRIYGITFPDKKLLKEHKELVEEAKKRDHRKIAREMELYTVSEDIGPGLILWLPKGNIIKEELENWAKETEKKHGYQRVTTPVVTKEGLFHTSEHLPHYADGMYPPMQLEGENYYIKPMNCPFHHKIFGVRTRSYRELPMRLAEYGLCHRYEQSGAIFGLMRVRGMDMNDAHIYCAKEDAAKEFVDVIKLHEYYYNALGITDYWMVLALRDPESDKYHGDEEMWSEAERLTREAMETSGVNYEVEVGGAAFYGPKIDFEVKSAIGRKFSTGTSQIDLFMPGKFELTYMGEDGHEHTPVCIHRAPLGTHERFIGFLLEHFAGKLPLWLAPEQVAIVPISEQQEEQAKEFMKELEELGVRTVFEGGGETLNKRVRELQLRRVPAIVVLGQKELEAGTVALRTLDGNTQYGLSKEDFVTRVQTAIKNRTLDFSNLSFEKSEE